jgi:hypothetical protein
VQAHYELLANLLACGTHHDVRGVGKQFPSAAVKPTDQQQTAPAVAGGDEHRWVTTTAAGAALSWRT